MLALRHFHYGYAGLLLLVLFATFFLSSRKSLLATQGVTVKEAMLRAERLNSSEMYKDSLNLLLGIAAEQPEDNSLKELLKKTFVLHIQYQILDGYKKIETNSHDEDAYLEVSNAYDMIQDQFRSMEILTNGVIENPKSVKLWLAVGMLEMQRKHDAEALSVFREVLRLDNTSAHAYNDIAFLHSRSEDKRLLDLKSALGFAEKAVSLDPKNANFLDTLAEITFRLGNKKEAVNLIKRAISLDPEEPFYQSQLSRFEAELPRVAK